MVRVVWQKVINIIMCSDVKLMIFFPPKSEIVDYAIVNISISIFKINYEFKLNS